MASMRTNTWRETRVVQPWPSAYRRRAPPASPRTTPAARPMRKSPAAAISQPSPPVASAPASATPRNTNGVAIPSLRPPSTFSSRRTRGRHRGVRHHGMPERCIGGSQRGADDQRDARRGAREQQEGREAPQRDRQQQADGQQSRDWLGVLAQRPDPDRGGVREEQQREGHLGEDLERLGLGLQRDRPEDVLRHQHADEQEDQGRSHRQALEASGDEGVPRHQQRQEGQVLVHASAHVEHCGHQGQSLTASAPAFPSWVRVAAGPVDHLGDAPPSSEGRTDATVCTGTGLARTTGSGTLEPMQQPRRSLPAAYFESWPHRTVR